MTLAIVRVIAVSLRKESRDVKRTFVSSCGQDFFSRQKNRDARDNSRLPSKKRCHRLHCRESRRAGSRERERKKRVFPIARLNGSSARVNVSRQQSKRAPVRTRIGGRPRATDRLDDLIKIPFRPGSPRLFNEARNEGARKKDEADRNVRILDGRPIREAESAAVSIRIITL